MTWRGSLGEVEAENPEDGGWSAETVMSKSPEATALNFWYHPMGYLVDVETDAVADA